MTNNGDARRNGHDRIRSNGRQGTIPSEDVAPPTPVVSLPLDVHKAIKVLVRNFEAEELACIAASLIDIAERLNHCGQAEVIPAPPDHDGDETPMGTRAARRPVSDSERKMILAHHVKGKSYAWIAQTVNRPRATVQHVIKKSMRGAHVAYEGEE